MLPAKAKKNQCSGEKRSSQPGNQGTVQKIWTFTQANWLWSVRIFCSPGIIMLDTWFRVIWSVTDRKALWESWSMEFTISLMMPTLSYNSGCSSFFSTSSQIRPFQGSRGIVGASFVEERFNRSLVLVWKVL